MANKHGGTSGKFGMSEDEKRKSTMAAAAAGAVNGLTGAYRKPSNSNANSASSPNPNPSVYPTSEQVQSAMREYAVLRNQPKYDFMPSEYQLKYGETIENLLKQLNDRNNAGFSYDPSSDPTLREYFKQYDLQADAAIDKSIGTYAPAGGGMSSTALALANEAAAAYEAKKNALVPEFYNAAYNKYLNQNATLADLANSYLALENNNYNIWANNEERRQAAAAQKYEQDYQKWLQDLDSIGYTVNEAGQAVEKNTSMAQEGNLSNMLVGALGSLGGVVPADMRNIVDKNTSQLESDAVIDEMLDSIYSGTNVWDFQKTLSDDENTRLGYLDSLVSIAKKYDVSDVFSEYVDEQFRNVGTGVGKFLPPVEIVWDLVGSGLSLSMLNAKYTKTDFKNYFKISGYSDSKAEEMASNVSKRYQAIDKNRSQYGTQYTADAIALAIKEELEKNPI